MALSFKEKRALQQEIQSCFNDLESGPDFKTKRALQKRITEAFAKLEEKVEPVKSKLLDDLLAGKFLKATPPKFILTVRKVLSEIGDDVSVIMNAVIDYVHANLSIAYGIKGEEIVAESASPVSFVRDSMNQKELARLMELIAGTPRGQQITLVVR